MHIKILLKNYTLSVNCKIAEVDNVFKKPT